MIDYRTITELAGDEITLEQWQRMLRRYAWACSRLRGRDVLEVACGSGPGLGVLAAVARSVVAADYTKALLDQVRGHYGSRVPLVQLNGCRLPFAARAFDVIVLFEAIYYLPSISDFVRECARVLRPGGRVLVATANKDLYDFNPSPASFEYPGPMELRRHFGAFGFAVECFGDTPISGVSLRQRVLRPVKRLAVSARLMPKSNEGKKWLKRLVFGQMIRMPAEIQEADLPDFIPAHIRTDLPDRTHKVIFCTATLAAP